MNNAENTLQESPDMDYDLHISPLLSQKQTQQLAQALEASRNARTQEIADLQQKANDLQDQFLRQRTQLLGSTIEQQLMEYSQRHRLAQPQLLEVSQNSTTRELQSQTAFEQQRLESINYAQQLNVDLTALKRLQMDFSSRFELLINRGESKESFQSISGFKPAASESNAIHYPPNYGGWWDRGGQAYQSSNGKVMQYTSALNPPNALIGNTIWSKIQNASNADYMVSNRENGLMVWHTVPYTSRLQVEIDFQCAYCQHCIQTWDEFGWSNGSGWTNEAAVVSVFWNWTDNTPATENIDYNLVWGLTFSGDGEKYPGVQYPVSSGLIRRLTLTTPHSFPQGATVAVYVGAQQRLYAWVNDVSVNSFVHSQWYLNRINVRNV